MIFILQLKGKEKKLSTFFFGWEKALLQIILISLFYYTLEYGKNSTTAEISSAYDILQKIPTLSLSPSHSTSSSLANAQYMILAMTLLPNLFDIGLA